MEKAKAALRWARDHKTQVVATTAALLALVSHFTDGVPAEAILSVVRAVLGV